MRTLATSLLVAGTASAQVGSNVAEQLRLSWHAPPDCPSQADVLAEVGRLLANFSAPPRATMLEVEARVGPVTQGFALKLTLHEGDAERSRDLIAPTCAELAHATALVVALAVNPALAVTDVGKTEASPPPPSAAFPSAPVATVATAPPPTPPAPAPAPPSQSAAPVVAPERAFWSVGLGARASVGALPEPLPGPVLIGGRGEGPWTVGAALSLALAETAENDRGARFLLLTLFPKLCWRVRVDAARLGPCLGADLGVLRGSGFGPLRTHTKWSP